MERPKPSHTRILEDAPASVRRTLAAIHDGIRDPTQLPAATGIPARTTRYAVRWLIDQGLVTRHARLGDARRMIVRPITGGTRAT